MNTCTYQSFVCVCESVRMILLTNLLKTQPKLLPKNLTFRPLSEAFTDRGRNVKFLGNNFGCVLSKLVNS